MALEKDRLDRSYQYGRMLALMEKAERDAYHNGEKREPNAMRMQSVFVRKPFTTANNVIKMLKVAYYPQLKPGQRVFYERELMNVFHMLSECGEAESDKPLTAAYLFGYYLQKEELYMSTKENREDEQE